MKTIKKSMDLILVWSLFLVRNFDVQFSCKQNWNRYGICYAMVCFKNMQLIKSSKCCSKWIESWFFKNKKHNHEGQMTSPIKATTVLTHYESMHLCVCGEWELKTAGTNLERPRLSCCLHIHSYLHTQRDYNIWNYQNICVWWLIQLAPSTWYFFPVTWITDETHWRKIHLSWCWDEGWGMPVGTNSALLYGDRTHGALLGQISQLFWHGEIKALPIIHIVCFRSCVEVFDTSVTHSWMIHTECIF
jgi:hypothetical protein